MAKVVIVGASIAGQTTATKLREQDKDCSITLLTEEKYLPYDRRRLVDFLSGTIKEESLFLTNRDFYQENNINFVQEKKVIAVNTQKKFVLFKDKGNIEYDFLVIASGRRPLLPEIPGARKNGVFALYSLDDYKELANRIISDPVCLIGSDEITLAVANAIATKYKVEVKLISGKAIDSSLLSPEVEVINAPLKEIIGEGEVQAVKIADGKAIGVSMAVFRDEFKSNIEFLKNSNIEISEDAILVDTGMQANTERIFACGSVARIRYEPPKLKTWDDVIGENNLLVTGLTKQMKGEICQTQTY